MVKFTNKAKGRPSHRTTFKVKYKTPAKRPLRATMDLSRLASVYGVTPRPWQDALKDIICELKAQDRPAA